MAQMKSRRDESPEALVHALDDAFMAGQVEQIVALYDALAYVTPRPGTEARGTDAIRTMYAEFVRQGAKVQQHAERVLEADGVALYLSRWTLTLPDGNSQEAVSTVVLRRDVEGAWKVLIDNAQGPALLETENT